MDQASTGGPVLPGSESGSFMVVKELFGLCQWSDEG